MKLKYAVAVAAATLMTAGAVQASPDLADKAGCGKCHALDTKKMATSYKDIAKKYKGNAGAEAQLVEKLTTGKGHPKANASEADVVAITKWILAQ